MVQATDDRLERAAGHLQTREYQAALRVCKAVLRDAPGEAHAWFLTGAARHMLGQLDLALEAFSRSAELDQTQPEYHKARGAVLAQLGRFAEAGAVFEAALALAPEDPDIHVNLGLARDQQGAPEKALQHFDRALALAKDHPGALLSRSAVLLRVGRVREALADSRRLAAACPELPEAHFNLAEAALASGLADEALAACDRVMALRPGHAPDHVERGLALASLGHLAEAAAEFDRARLLDPKAIESCAARAGLSLPADGRIDPAVIYLWQGYERQTRCDWRDRERYLRDLERMLGEAVADGTAVTEKVLIFILLALRVRPELRQRVLRSLSDHLEQGAAAHAWTWTSGARGGDATSRRLRIGYLSPAFHDHPSAYLTRCLYGLHDRGRFEVFCYSLRPGDGSAVRGEIEAGCDRFVELSGLDDVAAARRIREDGIDILVDLQGYYADTRAEILALRPAPVQVSWLGFQASMGARFIQYRIVDAYACPPAEAQLATERLAYLPHTFWTYGIPQRVLTLPTRAECGLPETGFVFCAFNNSYKIEPRGFELWMRILKRVPDAVLWLSRTNDSVEDNLRREAEARGVAGERLVFAPHWSNDRHLTRYRLAGLFLDTLDYNAHTTALDALWMGVPLLTCAGETQCSRIAASFLRALALDELIVRDLSAYEEQAVYWASDPAALAELRQRVEHRRDTAPLFDIARRVRELEAAYGEMWRRYAAGESVGDFTVGEDLAIRAAGRR